ncbi:MAG: class I SAM-dependent methyltransferase [Candidatus Hodarchaeota archaeon]
MGHKKSQSSLDFRFMSFFFKIRDFFKSPMKKIDKTGVKSGDFILDYGCGPGSYTFVAAEKVGSNGKIFATDIHPLAIKKVNKKALKKGLKNIVVIETDCKTGLDNDSIDIIMCFDVLHDIKDKECILKEFHRVLKPDSRLSFDDHHMSENEIIGIITAQGLFQLVEKKKNFYNFSKI